ncbi:hypothetical protein CVIRNUC_008816 [Coccomyxa viridis]|uniref:Uncharacterized protein n=1 Tax=Coccomyxa viridis TaxID=1274662 RepID=A0AAV1IGL5_9CHLO|nr:hypothetical protein CVIRNUC_008816 [Coccomyxa viridis]
MRAALLCISVAAALVAILPASAAGPRVLLEYFEPSNAGPYNENSLLGVPSEVNTGENIGQGEKVNVCKFPLGSVNNWELKPYIQYTSLEANAILETSGRGSFIAPAVGLLHYGPSCYLYDHVCNFNYQEPCNLRGDCQTNNTCFCTNGYKTCRANDGTITGASAGCETDIYEDDNNCGDCFNVCPMGTSCNGTGVCISDSVPSPPPPPPGTSTPSSNSTTRKKSSGTGLQTPGSQSTTGVGAGLPPSAPGVSTPVTSGMGSTPATGSTGTGPSTSSVTGPSSTGTTGDGNTSQGRNPDTTAGAGSSNTPDNGSNILGATPATSSVKDAEGGMSVVPGSVAARAARQAARKAANAAATAGRRLLSLMQGS